MTLTGKVKPGTFPPIAFAVRGGTLTSRTQLRIARIVAFGFAGWLAGDPASAAQCSNAAALTQWTGTVAGGGIAAAPAVDTGLVAGRSRSFVAHGATLSTFYNDNYPLGCVGTPAGNLCSLSGSCQRFKGCMPATWSPTPAALLSGSPVVVASSANPAQIFLFQAAANGRLYRIDVSGDPPYGGVISVDTRRASCPSDRLDATPAVQLYNFSSSAFQSRVDSFAGHAQDDVVFVQTSDSCGDRTHNRVIAYFASDLSKMWEFNAPIVAGQEAAATRMDAGTGCALDLAGDRLFCGTHAPAGAAQHSLWAFSTLTGGLLWSDNPGGSVLNRPTLNPGGGRLYAATESGALWSYSAGGDGEGGPLRLWSSGLSVATDGAVVRAAPFFETRPGTWQFKILVLDSAGQLFAVQDNGSSGTLVWSIRATDTGRWVNGPAVLPGAGESRAFLGRNDGTIQMVKLDGGQTQGTIQVSATTSQTVAEPTLDVGAGGIPRVIAVGGDRIKALTVPFCTNDPGIGAATCFDECVGVPSSWDPYCMGTACVTQSCRNPRYNPQYNPCRSLGSEPTFACVGLEPGLPDFCELGPGFGCRNITNSVPNGTPCDDSWPAPQGSYVDKGAGTCRADAVPSLVACTLVEGSDCNYQTGASQPGSRFKCVTKPAVCGAVGGGKCCVCNDGFGMNCNDTCFNGACVSDLYQGCATGQNAACVVEGDRACPTGQACCGSNKGGACVSDSSCTQAPQGKCLDVNPLDADATRFCYYQQCVSLLSDPQHCGACGNDCGEYRISTQACTDHLGCGACTIDAQCGLLGKCVNGTCGRCLENPAAPGSRVCHRLTSRGACQGGVCSQLPAAACTGPDLVDLAFASPIGMDALDYSFTNEASGLSQCQGYVTAYRSDGGAPLLQIDQSGATIPYSPSPVDGAHLHGVAVSRDGSQVTASIVDVQPGMALRPPGSAIFGRATTAGPTSGGDDNPFDQSPFNQGPVGPAFDYATYTTDTTRRAWFGNFPSGACTDLGLCRVDFALGSWNASAEAYCNQPCSDVDGRCEYASGCAITGTSQRITALAFERLPSPAGVLHRYLIVAHGTTLSFVDLDGGVPRQADINLASPAICSSDAAVPRGVSTIEAILSIATAAGGDVFAEVRGAGDKPSPGNVRNAWLVNISPHDQSCRHALDVQRHLKHLNPCDIAGGCPFLLACVEGVCMRGCGGPTCPPGSTCSAGVCRLDGEVPLHFGLAAGSGGGNGRIATDPRGRLVRWVARINQAPASFAEYTIANGPGGIVCQDGNACTTETISGGQCQYTPVDCADSDACTTDACDTVTGCTHTPVNCDDADVCTTDACDAGTCLHAPAVEEASELKFATTQVMQWFVLPGASFNTYRGSIPPGMLGSRPAVTRYDQTCFESADALGDGATQTTDPGVPGIGVAFYYLVSTESGGCESALGYASSGALVPNTVPCPTPP